MPVDARRPGDARRFLDKLDTDKKLHARAKKAREEAKKKLIDIGREAGYTFTAKELRQALIDKFGGRLEIGPDEDQDAFLSIPSERPGF